MARRQRSVGRVVRRSMVVGAAVILAACVDESGGLATVPTAPPAAIVPATGPPPTESFVSVVSAAAADSDDDGPEATDPPGIATLGEGPWRRVAGAPGIDTPGLFYELMPGLWAYLPVVEDIDRGILWTLRDKDVAIIEAYLQARLTYYRAVTQDPIDLDDEGWGRWYSGGSADWYLDMLGQHRSQGNVGDLDLGVVLHPQVIGDERSTSTATVFDCMLDGSLFLTPSGEVVPPSYRGIGVVGLAFKMRLIDGDWRVVELGSTELACL